MRSDAITQTAARDLASFPVGCCLSIRDIQAEPGAAQRLREMGIREGKTIRLLTKNDPLICQVGGCRFGLCHRLARCILVEPGHEPLPLSA
ncbi:MAG: ferrous iron transport protein A [Phycisphaerales bacterium]|nr:ferrous iron transport protein A [Phycisphaerales bacterium]